MIEHSRRSHRAPRDPARRTGLPPGASRIPLAWALLGAGVALLAAGPAPGEEKAPAAPPTDLAALEKELKASMTGGQIGRAKQIVDEFAAVGGKEACSIIIKQALSGVDYDLERHAGGVLGKWGDPEGKALILESLQKASNFKTRIILLAVAARITDSPEALAAIQRSVKDPIRQVVYAALSWIREIGRTEPVDSLIDELEAREKKPRDRIYFDIRKTLGALTGLELEAAAEWRSAWEARKKGGAPPAAEKKKSTTVVYKKPKPKFFAMDIESDRVLFVIDVSGSMLKKDPVIEEESPEVADATKAKAKPTTGVAKKEPPPEPEEIDPESLPAHRQRIIRVKTELSNAVSSLPPNTRFGILAFSHELEFWGGAKALKPATAENKASAVSWVRGLRAEGATRTDLALEEALSLSEVDSIFLLTDGAPQLPGEGGDTRLPIEPILADTKRDNRFLKCRIHTISFRQIRDRDMREFVQQLARQNDGVCKLLG